MYLIPNSKIKIAAGHFGRCRPGMRLLGCKRRSVGAVSRARPHRVLLATAAFRSIRSGLTRARVRQNAARTGGAPIPVGDDGSGPDCEPRMPQTPETISASAATPAQPASRPLLSVVLPNYNHGRMIARAVTAL